MVEILEIPEVIFEIAKAIVHRLAREEFDRRCADNDGADLGAIQPAGQPTKLHIQPISTRHRHRAPPDERQEAGAEFVLEEAMRCTCFRLRRAARHITQIYNCALEPVGLTVNQFSLLARLYRVKLSGKQGVPIGPLAEQMDTDPTTLNRILKPLRKNMFVEQLAARGDGRMRIISILDGGCDALVAALPLWRKAQAWTEHLVGRTSIALLNGLLDRMTALSSGSFKSMTS